MNKNKVLIIGIDSAPPRLIFDEWLDCLPNLKKLIESGVYGRLESSIPPITCPAWSSMMTSKDPGKLGFYGFRNRRTYSYDEMVFATSLSVKEDAAWDIVSRAGKKSILVGVPQTYPPRPLNGCVVTSFLTPDTNSQYTYPADLKREIQSLVGIYMFDVDEFRTENKDQLLRQIYEMTDKRFKVGKHLMQNREWDFFMLVEMGPDRIHHGFWKYFDAEHLKYEPGSKYESAVKDYYIYLDGLIGELLALIDDNTTVIVVSDHGAKRMDGGICLNQWLIKEGYLTLNAAPTEMTQLTTDMVDWRNTKAWGAGGYYGRVFLNVKGREPQGVIEPGDYDRVADELIAKLESLGNEEGRDIGTKVYRPKDVYLECNNIPPDLIIYFGDLYWRSVGSVGLNTIHVFENDTGPDDANHDRFGIFIMNRSAKGQYVRLDRLHLMDVAPTALARLGLPAPADMQGKVID